MAIKIILTTIFSLATLLAILFFWSRSHATEAKEEDISFTGIIEKFLFRSPIDGADDIVVSGKKVSVYPSWGAARFYKENNIPIGKMYNYSGKEIRTNDMGKNPELYLNKKVEVYCSEEKSGENDSHYTLIGKKEYYIKMLEE